MSAHTDLAELVEDFIEGLAIHERYTWSPERTAPENPRPGVDYPPGPLPKREQRKIQRIDPPLIEQLSIESSEPAIDLLATYSPTIGPVPALLPAQAYRDARPRLAAAMMPTPGSHEPVSGSKPGSKPPVNLDPLELLQRLQRWARGTRRELAVFAGLDVPKQAPVTANLAALRGLVLLPANTYRASDVAWKLRGYREEALVILGYQAAVVELSTTCSFCGLPLRTRSDATTDVWCSSGKRPLIGPAPEGEPWPMYCGETWPRSCWLDLISE